MFTQKDITQIEGRGTTVREVTRQIDCFLKSHISDKVITVSFPIPSVDRKDCRVDFAKGLQLGQHALISNGITCMVDTDSVPFDHVLQAGEQSRFWVGRKKFMRGGNGMDCYVANAANFPVCQSQASFRRNAVRQNALHMKPRENKLRVGTAMRPDLPCFMIDMIQMIMRTKKSVDCCHFFSRNRRRR